MLFELKNFETTYLNILKVKPEKKSLNKNKFFTDKKIAGNNRPLNKKS